MDFPNPQEKRHPVSALTMKRTPSSEMGSHTGESYLVDYTQRTSGTCLVTQVKYIFWITPGTCLVRSTTIEFRGPSGANDWKPFDLQDLTLSRCYEYLPFELIIGVIGWCSRGAFLLTCKRNGFMVQYQIWLFFNFDNTTRLRHMWSGPPMSPSPMSPCGAKAQAFILEAQQVVLGGLGFKFPGGS